MSVDSFLNTTLITVGIHVINLIYLENGPLCLTKLPDGGTEESNKMLVGLDIAVIIPNTNKQEPPLSINLEPERQIRRKKKLRDAGRENLFWQMQRLVVIELCCFLLRLPVVLYCLLLLVLVIFCLLLLMVVFRLLFLVVFYLLLLVVVFCLLLLVVIFCLLFLVVVLCLLFLLVIFCLLCPLLAPGHHSYFVLQLVHVISLCPPRR